MNVRMYSVPMAVDQVRLPVKTQSPHIVPPQLFHLRIIRPVILMPGEDHAHRPSGNPLVQRFQSLKMKLLFTDRQVLYRLHHISGIQAFRYPLLYFFFMIVDDSVNAFRDSNSGMHRSES